MSEEKAKGASMAFTELFPGASFMRMIRAAYEAAIVEGEEISVPSDDELKALALELTGMHEPNVRDYHDPGHPCDMFEEAHALRERMDPKDRAEVRFSRLFWMIILHDCIVKPSGGGGKNERQSAQFAQKLLQRLGYSKDYALSIKRGILATSGHILDTIPRPERPTVGLLLDIDLRSFAKSWEDFQKDSEAIWHEQKGHVSREDFEKGLQSMAKRWLNRTTIYHTKHFKWMDGLARANFRRLLAK